MSIFITDGKIFCALVISLLLRFTTHAADDFPALQTRYAPFGTLIVTQFISAPFPHPARANGHKYDGQFYSAAEHYSNSTVALFIPKNFHATDKTDFVVHFHGWRHTVANTLEQYQLVTQSAAADKNAILIVPEGPYNAPDSFGGKLEFHAEYFDKVPGTPSVREALERGEPVGKIAAGFQPGLDGFAKMRGPFLLYH